MNLGHLEDALALLEERNLSRAARRRNITQPAFSRRIRALEDWVGQPLVERGTNTVQILPPLVAHEADLREMLGRLEQLRRRIAHGRAPLRRVVMASQHAISARVFPQVVARFRPGFPDLVWRLRTLNREDCLSVFLRGDADMLMCYDAPGVLPLPFDHSVLHRIWARDELIPVVNRCWSAGIGADGRFESLPPLITYPPDSHFGRLIMTTGLNGRLLSAGAVQLVETAFTVGILELIVAGAGLGWVPKSLCQPMLDRGELLNLAQVHGRLDLNVALFARVDSDAGCRLLEALDRAAPDPPAGRPSRESALVAGPRKDEIRKRHQRDDARQGPTI